MNRTIHAVVVVAALTALGVLTPPAGVADAVAAGQAQRQAYENRLDTVRALATALERESGRPGVAEALAKVDASRREAAEMAAVGEYVIARSMLDEGYAALTATLGRLRGGEEVKAERRFATPAEEFRYEQACNDDYAQLIAGLVEGAARDDWRAAAGHSKSLREAADNAARGGDFATALKRIVESTDALKAILRRAGFPIT